eukprot:gnl/Spiro4/5063_TR2524_c0_g1_i2.p1 gnl/Spiro4/5063_TR2524_c0_g1~~gnl/Spiro4/5063_TR2524_c0_g1_i2.p1  ORF type:complete len:204 (-),score=15.58 gnl/Spiro4/5063_TR2524_c0_g1_i2:169-780(-)
MGCLFGRVDQTKNNFDNSRPPSGSGPGLPATPSGRHTTGPNSQSVLQIAHFTPRTSGGSAAPTPSRAATPSSQARAGSATTIATTIARPPAPRAYICPNCRQTCTSADDLQGHVMAVCPAIFGPDGVLGSVNCIEEPLADNIPNQECSICFENFLKGQVVLRLECLCVFHKNCIETWFKRKRNRVCPLPGHTQSISIETLLGR